MTKEEIRFEIDQLRKDKIIYAVESIAVTGICIFSSFIVFIMLGDSLGIYYQTVNTIVFLIFLVALLYFIFMVLGNTRRYLKVKHLEKSLK